MAYLACPFTDPEHQLKVLHRIEGGIEAARFDSQAPPHGHQMPDKHRASKKSWRPVRLEEVAGRLALGGHVTLVRIDNIGRKVKVQGEDDLVKRVENELVLMVE